MTDWEVFVTATTTYRVEADSKAEAQERALRDAEADAGVWAVADAVAVVDDGP